VRGRFAAADALAPRMMSSPLTRNSRWTRPLRASPHFVERGDRGLQW
jgi:hypothetical protein